MSTKPKGYFKIDGRYIWLALIIFVLILAVGIFIGRKLIAQDSVRELESQVNQTNDKDEFSFFNTLPDRKVRGSYYRIPQRPVNKDSHGQKTNNHQTGQNLAHGYTIQVAALRRQDEAKKVTAALKAMGYSAYLTKINLGTTCWYRVRVGWFSYRQEAKKLLHELSEKIGLKGFVVASSK